MWVPGQRLSPYEVLARLGSGGMGDVFLEAVPTPNCEGRNSGRNEQHRSGFRHWSWRPFDGEGHIRSRVRLRPVTAGPQERAPAVER
jgi:hypothetical protein